MRADESEATVIEHFASHSASPELVALARVELRKMRHVPDQAASIQRGRLEAALRRLNDLYLWQNIDQSEYQRQRQELATKLAGLPPPEESNLVAFDRAAATLLPMGEIIREAGQEHQRAIVRHIVERVEVRRGEVIAIEPRPEARPFFEGMAVAPPDGSRGAQPTFVIEGVSELVMELLAA